MIETVNKYCESMKSKESDTFMKLVMDHMGTRESSSDLSILDRGQAIRKMIPTLKSMGLYGEYIE